MERIVVELRPFHDRHEFVEWARVYGHLYGTPRKTLADKIDQGIDVLLEIDVQGALQVKKKFDDAVSIFILPPSMTVLRQRLQARASDSTEEIQRRLADVPPFEPKVKRGWLAAKTYIRRHLDGEIARP